jgi:hypothetical protein
MDEKYNQLLDEDDVSDASEKSKTGGAATPEKKLTSVPELMKKETSLPPDQPPGAAIPPPVNAVKAEKDEELEPDSEQDDPTGNKLLCLISNCPFEAYRLANWGILQT